MNLDWRKSGGYKKLSCRWCCLNWRDWNELDMISKGFTIKTGEFLGGGRTETYRREISAGANPALDDFPFLKKSELVKRELA